MLLLPCCLQVLEASSRLQLDWRRFLGLLLWYHSPQRTAPAPAAGPSTPLPRGTSAGGALSIGATRNQPGHAAAAIRLYASLLAERDAMPATAAHSSAVPPPLPPYAEEEALMRVHSAPLGMYRPLDLQYAVLQLWAAQQQARAEEAAAAAAAAGEGIVSTTTPAASPCGPPAAPVAALLSAAGHTSNASDSLFPWQLLTVLQALGAATPADQLAAAASDESQGTGGSGCGLQVDTLPASGSASGSAGGGGAAQESWSLVLAGHTGLISQLLAVGGLAEWAVFVALQLPDTGGWVGWAGWG
jgi:hypothetical protein